MAALIDRIAAISAAVVCVAVFATSAAVEPRVNRTDGLAMKKGEATPALPPSPLLGTLVQTHTGERVPLDDEAPTSARFDALLADRATGASATLDPRLLGLLRTLAAKYTTPEGGPPRIELVSGFRSPKLNEMMRKKGHHVASHSQHSLGHACDFRVVVPCTNGESARTAAGVDAGARAAECAGAVAVAIDPRELERAIRATGWDGGVGIYTLKDDWFVHADVGPNRSWFEGPRGAETAGMARTAQ